MKTKFYAQRQAYSGVIDIHMARDYPNGDRDIATNITLERVTPDNMGDYRPPLLSLKPEEAQSLMDELWNAGIRPTEGAGSAGAMAATQNHLKDMQRIAFRLLEGDQVALDSSQFPEIKVRS